MALTYRNNLKGHIISVPEPSDIIAAAEAEAERLARLGTKRARLDAELVMDKAHSRATHQRQTLTKMDESRRWERYIAPPVVVEPPTEAPAKPATTMAVVESEPAPGVVKAVKAALKPAAKTEPEA